MRSALHNPPRASARNHFKGVAASTKRRGRAKPQTPAPLCVFVSLCESKNMAKRATANAR